MKKITLISISLLSIILVSNPLKSQNMTDEQKKSYALGANFGEFTLKQGLTVNPDLFVKGFSDGLAGKNLLTMDEMQRIFQLLEEESQAHQKKASEAAKAEGVVFLEANKKKDGIITTPSGLQYKVITMGKGGKPVAADKVKVHYNGTLIDGTVFDSSVQRGEPITFALNQVIPGWTEGVQLMPVGSKFIFYIPSELAYGDRDMGTIKPGSTLIFEVELLEINPK